MAASMETGARLSGASEARFACYVNDLASVLGHADRVEPLGEYCRGLLLPGERKSVEPMAAKIAPGRTAAKHQSLLHFVGASAWSDEAMLAKVRERVLPSIEAQGGIEAWIVDDTGFAKKGVHSVGVARQYCGRLGKTDNCQIAVSLSIANHAASVPIAYRLYLTDDWAGDGARREKVHIPLEVKFQTKPEIALDQIRAALAAGVAPGVVLTDAAYGTIGAFRAGVTAMGLLYGGRRASQHQGLETRRRARAQEAQRARQGAGAVARRSGAQARISQGIGHEPARERVGRGCLARGLERDARVALRRASRATGLQPRQGRRARASRMVAHRMARG
jgi:SRSO17 transposase